MRYLLQLKSSIRSIKFCSIVVNRCPAAQRALFHLESSPKLNDIDPKSSQKDLTKLEPTNKNENNTFDQNEKVFANKIVKFTYIPPKPNTSYAVGSTTTDDQGNYSVTFSEKWEGRYAISGEQLYEYRILDEKQVDVKGGETVHQDIWYWVGLY